MDEEVTTQLTINLEQLDALLLSVTESMMACKERIDTFNEPDIVEKIAQQFEIPLSEAETKVEEQLALAESLLETYPSLLDAMREIYPELEKKEVEKSKIVIVQPSWRGR